MTLLPLVLIGLALVVLLGMLALAALGVPGFHGDGRRRERPRPADRPALEERRQ